MRFAERAERRAERRSCCSLDVVGAVGVIPPFFETNEDGSGKSEEAELRDESRLRCLEDVVLMSLVARLVLACDVV
jgi:hypothetical protein